MTGPRGVRSAVLALIGLAACTGGSATGAADAAPAPAASAVAVDAATTGADLGATLDFLRDGRAVRGLSLREIVARVPPETWTAYDPYYNRQKTWRAVPLARVLALGFEGENVELAAQELVLKARDGFTVPMPGKKALEAGGYVAFEDVDVPGWEPIGPQRANPGPFYLVWRNKEQLSLETHPRPWQLASIAIARFETTFPLVVPTGEPEGSPAMRGLSLFREQCILCHAINRQGGRVGPDLNVPKSIVEYRPEAQIRAYIQDPTTFRYGNMPSHPHLGDADLDALIAYFRAMKARKHDSDARDGGAP